MSHRLTQEDQDKQFELFLKESISDDSVDLGGSDKQPLAKGSQKSAQKPTVSWWQDDNELSSRGTGEETTKSRFIKAKKSQPETEGERLLGSGKSLRNSQTIREEDENPGVNRLNKEGLEGRGNTESEAVNVISMGLDTLEEEEEKARFFAQFEAEASSTIDYSKLNQELDLSTSTTVTSLRKTEKAVELSEDDHSQVRVTETLRTYPGSPQYSDDFENEENGKEPLKEKSKMSPILAKVSLYDSLDDTGGEESRKDKLGLLEKDMSYVQSGGSEMEALHEAYKQIHVAEDLDDHNHLYIPVEEKIHRPVSPSSPPHHARQSLQPASTNESEIPTAEELMRPIRLDKDHIRGFTLQPVSAVELDQGKTSCTFGRPFPDLTITESQLKQPEKADSVAGIKGLKRPTQKPPNHDLTWSITEEVDRLMQDHNNSSYTTGKVKKQLATRISSISQPSASSVRKTTVASVRGRKVQGRTAMTSRSTGISSSTAATAKTQSSISRSLPHSVKGKPTHSNEKDDYTAESGLNVSSELVASVQSLVAVLQQQIDPSSYQGNTHAQDVRGPQQTRPTYLPKNSRDEDSSLIEELRAQLLQKERELQMMKEGAEELHSLRQQNYLLQSKLRSAEEESQKTRWPEATDSAVEEKFQHIDKEMKEQETLIKGYQQENEKLYLQMKAHQAKSKANEEAMFNENQRLLNELAFTREQLNKTPRPVGNVPLIDHTQRITDLLAQINTFQRNEAKLSEEIHRLKQEKQCLEVDLQLMKKERDLAKAQVISTSGDKTFEMCVLEDKHREEVSALKKKLQWFAENQELLDRDASRLKAATAEIHQLREQVDKLKMEVSKRSSSSQLRKAKDKSADTKRMQDLERQVKELEHILRHRNPNSLPALIYAAASAGDQRDVVAATSPPSRITALLERRIQRLEAELENHDEEAKHSLRAMEQQFHRIKLRYEQQISELEQQLQQKEQLDVTSSAAGNNPWMTQVQTLQEELQQLKETHQEREKGLCDQIDFLQQQLKQKPQPSPGRHQRQAEAAFGARIERLNQELATKTRTIQELNRTVERLQKERRSMLSVPSPRPETCSAEAKRQPDLTIRGEEMFPVAQYEKTYQPTVFTGSHIIDVQQENEVLRQRLELLQLQSEREKEALQADAVQAKEELGRLKEHLAEQLSTMKAEHLRKLDQLHATYALEHSSSKLAEVTNKLNTQELTRLLKELKEAKEAQSPEVKLLCSLERKILNMEVRHQHREKELQQVIGGSWQTLEANQQSEVERWRHLAQDKSRELEAFRLELDTILDILRHLQSQGVVFSTPDPLVPHLTQS
uniref:Centrosomal protein of 162 kDa n=1 Tax=Mastacembelus armatus TaxID=205130 RepID=A0A7N9AVL2_9TELE